MLLFFYSSSLDRIFRLISIVTKQIALVLIPKKIIKIYLESINHFKSEKGDIKNQ